MEWGRRGGRCEEMRRCVENKPKPISGKSAQRHVIDDPRVTRVIISIHTGRCVFVMTREGREGQCRDSGPSRP